MVSYVRMVSDGKKPGGSWADVRATPGRWGTLSLEFGSSDLVCEAHGLLGHWLPAQKGVKRNVGCKAAAQDGPSWALGAVSSRPSRGGAEREVPAPAAVWQKVQGAARLGCPAARSQLWWDGSGAGSEGRGAARCCRDEAPGSRTEGDRRSSAPPPDVHFIPI